VTTELPPLSPPQPLQDRHRLDGFGSGVPSLDDWLRRKARANQASGASRSYVLCRGDVVVGYYALAAGSVSHEHLPRGLRRNVPHGFELCRDPLHPRRCHLDHPLCVGDICGR
jgi:hypothetical protein